MRPALALSVMLAPGVAAADTADGLVERLDACIELVGASGDNATYCMGIYTEPCIDISDNQTTAGTVECISVETDAWDEILNREYAMLLGALDEAPRAALRDAQRKWVDFRDADCAFPQVLIEGTLAHPWSADCVMQHTARRAVELRGILEYVEY